MLAANHTLPPRNDLVDSINRVIQNFAAKPIFLQIDNRVISGYGAFLTLGLGLGTFYWLCLVAYRCQYHLPSWPIILGMVLSVYIGSRLLFGAEQKLACWLSQKAICKQGHVFYGGIAGGLIYGGIVFGNDLAGLLIYADCVAPALALGYAVSKLGCLSYGCCVGRPTRSRLAVRYMAETSKAVGYYDLKGIPLIPVQVYESMLGFALFVALSCQSLLVFGTGRVMGLFLLLLTGGRMILWRLRYRFQDDRASDLVSATASLLLIGLSVLLLSKGVFRPFDLDGFTRSDTEPVSLLSLFTVSAAVTLLSLYLFGVRRFRIAPLLQEKQSDRQALHRDDEIAR